MWITIFWTIGCGFLFALWSLLFELREAEEDAQNIFIYFAKGQRAFMGGCILGFSLSYLATALETVVTLFVIFVVWFIINITH